MLDKMEAGLAGGPGKFQSRQLHSASWKLPSEPRFAAVQLCVSGCLADGQLLGGCLLDVASACGSSPLSSAGGGVGAEGWGDAGEPSRPWGWQVQLE